MADKKNIEIPSLFGDTIKQIVESLGDDKKSSSKKTTTAKKTSTAKKASTAKKSTTAKKTATARKTTTAKKTTATKKVNKIIFEIGGKQIDMKAIEKKAAKLGGTVYVVANERKMYDSEGNSIKLFD